jgi:hypothetical protein
MQGSLWMAMALCRRNAVSVTFDHENLDNIQRLAPPDSEVGGWTSTILYVLGDGGVFRGWHRLATSIGRDLTNRNRDRLMEKTSRDDQLILVSRDARARREATAMKVDAVTPEEYAERVMTREDARTMFEVRSHQALSRYIAVGTLDDWLLKTAAMDNVGRLPRAIWSPPDEPWFPSHERAHWHVPLIR